MTYYEDLSPYEYSYVDEKRLNVGWLDEEHEFPVGAVDPLVVQALLYSLRFQSQLTRGIRPCVLCRTHDVTVREEDGTEHLLGMAEIHVDGADGSAFAAPSLVVHYVTEHGYQPPEAFCTAVVEFARFYGMSAPPPQGA